MRRRGFLLTAGAAGVGVATGLAAAPKPDEALGAVGPGLLDRIPFDGHHQEGILTPPQQQAIFVALDAVTPNAAELTQALQALSFRARSLTHGGSFGGNSTDEPPTDSGTLGPSVAPDSLTVTIGFGASLFDRRFGLAARRPPGLVEMPSFPGDVLDPARSHGDVMVQICAQQRDTVVHAIRELMRSVHGAFEIRWTLDGFKSADRGPKPGSAPRNLFGFRDGTANPDPTDAAEMNKLVWTHEGGTFQVIRTIRMHVEFWDRVGLREQENMIGRDRAVGAPLGGDDEHQNPRLDLDPKGERIPLDAHIRLANPRTKATDDQRILRRPFNYHRGFDAAGQLDQGLVFVAFNQDIERQFATVQKRLDGEPMTDYITPVGGGYFYVPQGTGDQFGWVGRQLLTA